MIATAEEVYTPFASGAMPGTSIKSINGGSLGAELRAKTSGVRVTIRRFGASKILTAEQTRRAAGEFDAEARMVKASKKLLDTNHKLYKAVTSVLSKVRSYWNLVSIEYPVRGVRLIRKSRIEEFETQMAEFQDQLSAALGELENHYQVLRDDQREALGELWNYSDYPATISQEFGFVWDYPAIEPPDMLKELHPDIWARQQAQVAAQFEQAAATMEAAFAEELQKLVVQLSEKLSAGPDEKKKCIGQDAFRKVSEFFAKFRQTSVTSSEQLDAIVTQAMGLLAGKDPKDVRKSDEVRTEIATGLAEVQQQLEALIVERPTRKITFEEE